MKNLRFFLILFIVALIAFLAGFFVSDFSKSNSITGKVVLSNQYNYSWTTAICNENKCIDILIECEDGEVKSIKPLSDLKEFENNWEDRRDNLKDYCE